LWLYRNAHAGLEKGAWTQAEDDIIELQQSEVGNRWAYIAAKLPGRTENAVKIRAKLLQRAQAAANGDERAVAIQKRSQIPPATTDAAAEVLASMKFTSEHSMSAATATATGTTNTAATAAASSGSGSGSGSGSAYSTSTNKSSTNNGFLTSLPPGSGLVLKQKYNKVHHFLPVPPNEQQQQQQQQQQRQQQQQQQQQQHMYTTYHQNNLQQEQQQQQQQQHQQQQLQQQQLNTQDNRRLSYATASADVYAAAAAGYANSHSNTSSSSPDDVVLGHMLPGFYRVPVYHNGVDVHVQPGSAEFLHATAQSHHQFAQQLQQYSHHEQQQQPQLQQLSQQQQRSMLPSMSMNCYGSPMHTGTNSLTISSIAATSRPRELQYLGSINSSNGHGISDTAAAASGSGSNSSTARLLAPLTSWIPAEAAKSIALDKQQQQQSAQQQQQQQEEELIHMPAFLEPSLSIEPQFCNA
jgi:Myb-like DNA-binding domain